MATSGLQLMKIPDTMQTNRVPQSASLMRMPLHPKQSVGHKAINALWSLTYYCIVQQDKSKL
jgi:hypothetical protein